MSSNREAIPGTLYFPVIIGCAGVILLCVSAFFSAECIWDDAYMYVRYAHNFIHQGKISWNPGAEPSYGLTSLAYLFLVVPMRLLISHNTALPAQVSSILCGCLFIVLLIYLVRRNVEAGPPVKRFLVIAILISFVIAGTHLTVHFLTGMDTMFALCYLTFYIIVLKWYKRRATFLRAAAAGLLGGISILVRPDLMLFTYVTPLAVFIFSGGKKERWNAAAILLITAVITGLHMFLASRYFGTALPLPFYAKSMHLYGFTIYNRYRFHASADLLIFVACYWMAFLAIGLGLLLNFREWLSRSRDVEMGLLLASFLFICYYLFFVLQIMGKGQRFYYPALPALMFLASQSAVDLIRKISPEFREAVAAFSARTWAVITLALLCFLAVEAVGPAERLYDLRRRDLFAHFDPETVMLKGNWYYRHILYFALDDFSRLPDDLVMATTEIGMPAVLNLNQTIIDLAGLNQREFSRQKFSAQILIDKFKPDLIYVPYADYREMQADILNNPAFQEKYDYFPDRSLGTLMGVALLRESKHYPAMKQIVEKKRPCGM